MSENYDKLISTLGYNQLWFDNGLLTHELLVAQYQTLLHSDDQHTEHYRYGALRHYLNSRTHLTDEELRGYFQVVLAEQDSMMGGAAAKDLFTDISLTDQQFAEACEKLDGFPGDWTTTIRLRHLLLRRLGAGVPNDALFEECLTHGDTVVQKVLLEVCDVSQLLALAGSGSTLSIRNMAAQKLKKHSR